MEAPQFQIVDHRLQFADGTVIPFVPTPNQGNALEPQYLIMHYTAGKDAESTIRWFTNPDARASAHIVISRDGEVTQLVNFNRQAWHAGRSEWNGLTGMNRHSIGIELDNAGRLTRRMGKWYAWFDEFYPDDEVLEATHKHQAHSSGWHTFTNIQLETALGVASALVKHYRLSDVIGHDDVAPYRKVDPGPAFPMLSFRSRVIGREDDFMELYETTTNLNIRIGPGTDFEKLDISPLAKETEVIILNSFASWKYVEVTHEVADEGCGIKGWVSGRYLKRVEV